MDWDKMRQQWQEQTPAPAGDLVPVDVLQDRDRALWRKVRWRDLIETVAALVVAVFFALLALEAVVKGNWLAAGSALLIAAWAVFVPFHLHRARRLAPEAERGMPLLAYLQRQRDAMLAQARMLEQVWLWYLGPPAIGLVGLTLGTEGATPGALAYLCTVFVMYVGVGWLNRYTARTKFRAQAAMLQRQIDHLTAGDA